MMRKSLVRLSILIIGVVIVGAFGWFNWASNARAGNFYSDNKGTEGAIPVFAARSEDGSIEYGYGVEVQTRFAGAMVSYDYLTKEGIEQYVAFNHTALDRLIKSASEDDALRTLVTFNRPLTQAEFVAFVEQYHLSVKSYTIWVKNSDGTTTTIQGVPSETELIPTEQFNDVFTDTQSRGGQRLPGWVEVDGSIPAGKLKDVAGDSGVFLADVMAAVIQEQFTDTVMKQVGVPPDVRTAVLREDLQVSRPPLAWQIHELGLENLTP